MSQHAIAQPLGAGAVAALRRAVGVGLLAGLVSVSASAAQSADPVRAIWKPQEISFYFQSFTTFYSCTGLEDKLERILAHLGAHVKAEARSPDCTRAVAQMPRVTLELVSPVEATPQALADREKGKSTRELVARVRGEREELEESLKEFPAHWQRVSMTRGELDLDPGDCELIEQLTRDVLPKLAVRIVENDVHCTPHQLTLGQPRLIVEALVETPKPDEARGGGQKGDPRGN